MSRRFVIAAVLLTLILGAAWTLFGATNDPTPSGSSSASTSIVRLGHRLQAQGFAVSQHPAFGGVCRCHTPGSLHYSARAIDVNASVNERARLTRLTAALRRAGWHVIYNAPGHRDHLHADR